MKCCWREPNLVKAVTFCMSLPQYFFQIHSRHPFPVLMNIHLLNPCKKNLEVALRATMQKPKRQDSDTVIILKPGEKAVPMARTGDPVCWRLLYMLSFFHGVITESLIYSVY